MFIFYSNSFCMKIGKPSFNKIIIETINKIGDKKINITKAIILFNICRNCFLERLITRKFIFFNF